MTAELKHFEAEASSLRSVRELVRREAEVDLSHAAVLVASELASNAIVHTRQPFTVRVQIHRAIRIEVIDSEPELPAQNAVSIVGETGHGLTIVDKLSEKWGSNIENGSKVVWAEVPA